MNRLPRKIKATVKRGPLSSALEHRQTLRGYMQGKERKVKRRISDHIGESISEPPAQKVQMKTKSSYRLKRHFLRQFWL